MARQHWRAAGAMLATALVLVGCQGDQATAPQNAAQDARGGGHGAPAGQRPKAGMEINYMEFVIDHHTMGIMMAELCVQKAVHDELRALCQRNIEAQRRERAMLQQWLQEWYGISYSPSPTQGDRRMMEKLAALNGAEFEIEFMETFSRHHHQVIQRSQPIVRQAVHEQLRQLARQIIAAQTTDIRLMLTWLCEWYDICHPRFGVRPE